MGLECGPVAYVCALPDTALCVVVVSSSSCGLDLLGWASLFTAHTSKCSGGVAQAAQNTYISAKTAFQSLSFETFAENSSILAGSVRPSTYIRMYTKGVWQSSGEEEETRESSSSPASQPVDHHSKNRRMSTFFCGDRVLMKRMMVMIVIDHRHHLGRRRLYVKEIPSYTPHSRASNKLYQL